MTPNRPSGSSTHANNRDSSCSALRSAEANRCRSSPFDALSQSVDQGRACADDGDSTAIDVDPLGLRTGSTAATAPASGRPGDSGRQRVRLFRRSRAPPACFSMEIVVFLENQMVIVPPNRTRSRHCYERHFVECATAEARARVSVEACRVEFRGWVFATIHRRQRSPCSARRPS